MLALADVAVNVSNAQRSAKWWEEKLGFSVHHVGGNEHALMVAPKGDRFVLHLCEGYGPLEPGNSGIAFMSDEIEELASRMEKAGVHFSEPLKKNPWGASAKFEDPDGNVFWLLGAPPAFVKAEAERTAPHGTPRAVPEAKRPPPG